MVYRQYSIEMMMILQQIVHRRDNSDAKFLRIINWNAIGQRRPVSNSNFGKRRYLPHVTSESY